ncbi:helix-turn-helix domain-containing protein [Evtepia sp.]
MDTDLGRQLGENLKQLRRERGLTLGQLAALAGLSKAMLSDMEKGGANPTVNTIWKLANGLKVPYTRLLEGEAPAATLVRGADLRPQTEGDGHYRVYCAFPGGGQRNFELFYMELDPQCAHTSAGHLAQPQEYVCLLQGQLVVETGGQGYTLAPGDALAFDSTQAHTYRNPGDTPVRGIVLNYFPS